MRLLLPLVLFGACAPDDPSTLADGEVPPPLTPSLFVSPLLSGADMTMVVTDATPGANVWYLLSTVGQGNGPCHPVYPDCASLSQPVIFVGRKTADGAGNASLTRTVPPTWDNEIITFQAFVEDGTDSGMSNVVERLIGDDDLDFVYDADDNCLDLANPPQIDVDGDGFGLACDCDDADIGVNLSVPDPTVDGVDQNCDGFDGPVVDFQGDYSASAVFTTITLGVQQPCIGTADLTYDTLSTPPLTGEFNCTASTLLGTFSLFFVVGGTSPRTAPSPPPSTTSAAPSSTGPASSAATRPTGRWTASAPGHSGSAPSSST
jgi:hypothetical protein